jgi:hypothetical protein|tara:strand:- start:363 stop:551 length:189 start_codon:yes stop_codon:yes gene_type:complete
MNVLMILFALVGGGLSDKILDPASMAINQIVKGVYDEARVQTVVAFEEKNAPNFMDKTRILE